MTIFFYDKSLEGLLTAVFDAYKMKLFPDKLMGIGEIPPIFVEQSYTVVTEEAHSSRVWKALEKKLSKMACHMLTLTWLSEEAGSDETLFRYIRKTIDAHESIELNFADEDVLRMELLARKSLHEAQYIRQFLRFQKAADGIFFAAISPKCNALPLAIDHFQDRFSDQKWVIYDIKRDYGFYYDLKTVTEITLDQSDNFPGGKLDRAIMAEDEKLFQDLWRGYYKAMAIKERINPRLHRHNMPRRFWKYLTEKQ